MTNNIQPITEKPPWVKYPESTPMWGGWRQGDSEAWLQNVWLPFWKGLSATEREIYLSHWPYPSEDWYMYLTKYWIQ